MRAARGGSAKGLLPGTLVDAGALAASVYLTVVGGLLFWSLAPTLFGLTPVVVRTGSMQPAVRPGDVLLFQHLAAASVRPGEVVVAVNPARPDQLLSHRVVKVDSNGDIVTRGDANRTADSTPVAPGQLKGVARLRVPFVGLPTVWWWQGRRATAVAWLALSGIAVLLTGSASAAVARHDHVCVPEPPGRHPLPVSASDFSAR